ncbi:MAG: type II toxin-antitoxin system RelE/ParE family toxin [Proteobacteria bacterium]|nr:type II toxin-antitoxin system RelE/ParE family toxin [Pseudomonadota bacterium]
MHWRVNRKPDFKADLGHQFVWYFTNASEDVAWQFVEAVDRTLEQLRNQPFLGRRRCFRHPLLAGLRSFRVEPPFNRFLIFYRAVGEVVDAWRLMHGGRDLAQRLVEPPNAD